MSIIKQVCVGRELGSFDRAQGRIAKEIACDKMPESLKKEWLRLPFESSFDKIFSSRWVSSRTVCFTTKDNKLGLWDYSHKTLKTVDVLSAPAVPEEDARGASCGVHDLDLSPEGDVIVTAGSDNPCDSILLSFPDLKTIGSLRGHTDWIFASKFLSPTCVMTASRDQTVRVWRIPLLDSSAGPVEISASYVAMEHSAKVRCLEHSPLKKMATTLSADGMVKLWDETSFGVVRTFEMDPEDTDLVSLALDDTRDCFAVGCKIGAYLYDTRVPHNDPVVEIPAQDDWGVRSIAITRDVVTVGSGAGKLSFFDLRKNEFRYCSQSSPLPGNYLLCSPGHIEDTVVDPNYEIPQAAYTLQYNPEGTALFVGGGPLMSGFRGCYGSIWG